jgi:hypothetical protein
MGVMKRELMVNTRIADAIHLVRGQKVMLDRDLAALYGVSTKALNQAVSRNRERFPDDFVFQLTREEVRDLRSQSVTSSLHLSKDQPVTSTRPQIVTGSEHGGTRYQPSAFTEQGVAMLSSVLRSDRAVQVNIAIMRAFVHLRAAMESNRALEKKFSELERRVGKHDREIAAILEAIRQLIEPPAKPPRQIGFHVRETRPRYRTRKAR